MALTYDQLSATTRDLFIPKMTDNILTSNSLLNRMKKKNYVLKGGGEHIFVPVMYATTSANGWYQGADALTTTDNDQFTKAQFEWAQLYANITITRADELMNGGDEQVIDLVKSKVQVAEKTLADSLGQGLFTGSGVPQISGLDNMIASGNATYGGIDRTTNSWWKSNVNSSTTVISVSGFQSLLGSCTIDADKPTLAITTQSIYNDIFYDIEPNQRFVDPGAAQAGFTSVMVNGVPVFVDSHATAKSLYLINEKYYDLIVHRDENFRFEPFIKPVNQNVNVAKVYWMGSLVSYGPRFMGKFSNLG